MLKAKKACPWFGGRFLCPWWACSVRRSRRERHETVWCWLEQLDPFFSPIGWGGQEPVVSGVEGNQDENDESGTAWWVCMPKWHNVYNMLFWHLILPIFFSFFLYIESYYHGGSCGYRKRLIQWTQRLLHAPLDVECANKASARVSSNMRVSSSLVERIQCLTYSCVFVWLTLFV